MRADSQVSRSAVGCRAAVALTRANGATLRLRTGEEDLVELCRAQNSDTLEGAKREQMGAIAGDEIVGPGGNGRGDDRIILWVIRNDAERREIGNNLCLRHQPADVVANIGV